MSRNSGRWFRLLLFACAVVAFVYGATPGSVQTFYVDEGFYDRYAFELANRFVQGEPVHFSYVHPSGYSMVLSAVFGGYYLWGRMAGEFAGLQDFLVRFATHRETFVVLARYTSAVFAAITVVLTYRLARTMFGQKTALLASVAVGCCYPLLFYTHIAANITMLTFLTVAATSAIERVWRRGRAMDYLAAGAFIGAGIGTKYYPAVLFAPLAIAHVMRLQEASGWRVAVTSEWWKLAAALVVSVPVAAVLFPVPIVAYEQWRASFADTLNYYTGGNPVHNAWLMIAGNPAHWAQSAAEPYSWWANSLRCLTPVGLVWLGGALAYGARRFPRPWLLLATPFCVMFALQAVRGGLGLGIRQLYFALPLLWILAAAVALDIMERLKLRPAVVGAICGLLLLQPFLASARFLVVTGRPTTVDVGRAWVLRHVPRGSILLVDSGAAPYGETEGWWEGKEVPAGHAADAVAAARAAIATYRIVQLKGVDAQQELAAARQTDRQVFVVLTDYFSTAYWEPETVAAWGNLSARRAPAMRRYWDEVRAHGKELQVIRPRDVSGMGPTVSILAVDPARN